MEWDKEASARLEKVPVFVRKMARSKIEKFASERGKTTVSVADVEEVKAGFMGTKVDGDTGDISNADPVTPDSFVDDDKYEILKRSGEYELENGYPAMYNIEVCRGEEVDCPFLIIGVKGLLQKIKDRLKEVGFSKLLISKIEGKLLPHHRLKIALASCPNACSKPQIKDFGIHVRAKVIVAEEIACNGCKSCLRSCKENAIKISGLSKQPHNTVMESAVPPPDGNSLKVKIHYKRCLHCGLCAEVCPTGSIKRDEPSFRVMIGGKLGRHPRFADDLIEFANESEVLKALDICIDAILTEKQEKRFGTLVERLGIDEFKRRLGNEEYNPLRHTNKKEMMFT
ncbi:MAG: 4Fe-4S dicluster domain-containing protein [Candidatus Scalindua sp. AMX11]|nr:MAG: 4Fe-4S dicluster domain-containing protein [Candidatus Scalindua sp.]NOG83036.1 4Fe-4S dicluster domain-containing protein [Planctomycetota bacterium]RZV79564.1 MAG: 4Fe-4S dicluster domain-containing protein [Candidatus Scalindua sp. SCAELEC01]TDE65203.1 MAG: 4Fe-4S dicluster domain-containing protein [Candidatus Scalindua sp. AMX11]GJQ58561.1 MAG: hypothetical protein SCALA701_13620 [Candidatus Scalindua sp.]